MNLHLISYHEILQAILPKMKSSGYGRIINIISTSVKQPLNGLGTPFGSHYGIMLWETRGLTVLFLGEAKGLAVLFRSTINSKGLTVLFLGKPCKNPFCNACFYNPTRCNVKNNYRYY